jgi:hypothetical protein
MKFFADRLFVDPDTAARKLVEIANGVEAVQDTASGSPKICNGLALNKPSLYQTPTRR